MIGILVIIKTQTKGEDFKPKNVEPKFPRNGDVVKSLSFRDYLNAINRTKTCIYKKRKEKGSETNYLISNMSVADWPVPFLKCDTRKCDRKQEQNAADFCSVNILSLIHISEPTRLV